MPYCSNCGNPLDAGDHFCSNCGTAVGSIAPVTSTVNAANRNDYRIVLVSKSSCKRSVAIDMISDLLGYTDDDAARIVDNAPMEVALGLTGIQAQYISQAMVEYGMEIAIYNGDGYVDMGSSATSSVFDGDGSFLSTVAAVLAGLTIGNRVTRYDRWSRPAPVLFRPAYRRPAPPSAYHRRRPVPKPAPAPIPIIHNAATPAPRPATRPVPARRQTPVPRPAVQPPIAAPRPTPASRPGNRQITAQVHPSTTLKPATRPAAPRPSSARRMPPKPGGGSRGGNGPIGPGGHRP